MKLITRTVSFLLITYSASSIGEDRFGEIADNYIVRMESECQGYGEILAKVKTEKLTKRARDEGVDVPDDLEKNLLKIEIKRCKMVHSIRLLEATKKTMIEEDWAGSVADKELKDLYSKLEESIKFIQ